MTLSSRQRLLLLYSLLLLACLLLGTLGFLVRALRLSHLSAELDYGEGIVLWQALHITDFNLVYKPLTGLPYIVTHYPPVYHLLTRIVASFVNNWQFAGRLISLAGILALAIVNSLLVWRLLPRHAPPLHRFTCAAFAGFSCFGLFTREWAILARVDFLAIFLVASAVALFILSENSTPGQFIAFTIFVLALYTKQTMLAAPAACFLYVLRSNPKRALHLAAFSLVLGLLPLLYLMPATHGGFLLNLFRYNQNPFHIGRMVTEWMNNFKEVWPLAAVALTPVLVRRRDVSPRAIGVLSLYLATAFLITATVGKEGSNYNYFIEFNTVCGVLAGIALYSFFRSGSAVTIGILLLLFVLPMAPRARHLFGSPLGEDLEAKVREHDAVLAIVKQTKGMVYSQDMTILLQAGKEIPGEPSILALLARTGVFDETPIHEMIRNHQFELIIVKQLNEEHLYTPATRKLIQSSYHLSEVVEKCHIYRPNL